MLLRRRGCPAPKPAPGVLPGLDAKHPRTARLPIDSKDWMERQPRLTFPTEKAARGNFGCALRKEVRVALNAIASPTPTVWTSGVGVLGRAVQDARSAGFSKTGVFAKPRPRAPTPGGPALFLEGAPPANDRQEKSAFRRLILIVLSVPWKVSLPAWATRGESRDYNNRVKLITSPGRQVQPAWPEQPYALQQAF